MEKRFKILIIEDEKTIADILEFNLNKEGFDTLISYDGEDGFDKAIDSGCDLILLDVMLPKLDGWEVLRRVRQKLTTPVIMLTAREEEMDKITGLELGADDYITKPFSMKELIARVRANLRRSSFMKADSNEGMLTFRNLRIDKSHFTVFKNNEQVELSNKEFALLLFLAEHLGKVYSREQLMEQVWGYEGFYGDLRAVDVMVRRIREKIERDSSDPDFIKTKRGVGYYFDF
ncbi:MAG: winged helix-turn-helix domain-containing protein [Bacillota bacterium]|nr:winged helix-turn-helix domain-containing protein [Bacillota bacterium]